MFVFFSLHFLLNRAARFFRIAIIYFSLSLGWFWRRCSMGRWRWCRILKTALNRFFFGCNLLFWIRKGLKFVYSSTALNIMSPIYTTTDKKLHIYIHIILLLLNQHESISYDKKSEVEIIGVWRRDYEECAETQHKLQRFILFHHLDVCRWNYAY